MTIYSIYIGYGWRPLQSAFIAPLDGVYLFSYSTVAAVTYVTEINLRLSTGESQIDYSCVLWNTESDKETNGKDSCFYRAIIFLKLWFHLILA